MSITKTNILYPIGIQDFEKIREGGFVYIDKTSLVHRIVTTGQYYFLSRPRRFGKSLLISTLEAYFLGKKKLFKGLAMEKLEKEWDSYPVLHFDFTSSDYNSDDDLDLILNDMLSKFEEVYGSRESEKSTSLRFKGMIQRAYLQTGKQVVILVDEYDKPLLSTIDKPELQSKYRNTLKAFYSNVKSMDHYIRFAFFTGVTKFSHVSIFSDLNNLNDISMWDDYSSLCGITEEELHQYFDAEVESIAVSNGMNKDNAYAKLRKWYDGYHFSTDSEGVYNPFSLLNVLQKKTFMNYWFSTGTPTYLVKVLQRRSYDLENIEEETASADYLSNIDSEYSSPLPLFYQSGYLTIKGNARHNKFRVGFPNLEVKEGFLKFLLPFYLKKDRNVAENFIDRIIDAAEVGNPDVMLRLMQTVYANVPFESDKGIELHYRNIIFLVMYIMGMTVEVEHPSSWGRMDFVMKTEKFIYVFEFKLDKSAEEALLQIDMKQYAVQYAAEGRKLYCIGVNFSSKTKNIDEWKIKLGQ